MARRSRQLPWTRSLQRAVSAMTRDSLRAGVRAGKRALKQAKSTSLAAKPAARKRAAKPQRGGLADCVAGIAFNAAGARRYQLYKPPGLSVAERLPLLVMLHGCGQDAGGFALSTRMNRIAARERFLVLYVEQDRLANPQGCWNWYEVRSRRAFGEAAIIRAAVDQACLLYPIDPQRIGIAGMSAGAGMAALVAIRYPERFKAVAMHSGVPPGVADSTASAIRAMRGRAGSPTVPDGQAAPDHPEASDRHASSEGGANAGARAMTSGRNGQAAWPPLLVIHGSRDHVVSTSNAAAAARLWAESAGAAEGSVRQVQRGTRLPMTVTDFKSRGRLAATLCEVDGLGHAWSGGDSRERFSDSRGPDASRLVWSFMSRRFRDSALSRNVTA